MDKKISKNDAIIANGFYKVKTRTTIKYKPKKLNMSIVDFVIQHKINKLYLKDMENGLEELKKTFKVVQEYGKDVEYKQSGLTFFACLDTPLGMLQVIDSNKHLINVEQHNDEKYIQEWLEERQKLIDTCDSIREQFGIKRSMSLSNTLPKTAERLFKSIVKKQYGEINYNRIFNVKKHQQLDASSFLRHKRLIHGGFMHLKEAKQYDKTFSYDINSAFPHHLKGILPVGIPVKRKRAEQEYLTSYTINISRAKKKNTNMIPFLRVRHEYKNLDKVEDEELYAGDNVINVWKEELEFIKKHYDITYKVRHEENYIKFAPFKDIIDKVYAFKYTNGNIKMMLNSFIGMMISYKKIEGKDTKEALEIIEQDRNTPPLQMSSYCYSQTRLQVWREIEKEPEKFVSSNTDSIITKEPLLHMDLSKRTLGKWKYEGKMFNTWFFGFNNYIGTKSADGSVIGKGIWTRYKPQIKEYLIKYNKTHIQFQSGAHVALINNELKEIGAQYG